MGFGRDGMAAQVVPSRRLSRQDGVSAPGTEHLAAERIGAPVPRPEHGVAERGGVPARPMGMRLVMLGLILALAGCATGPAHRESPAPAGGVVVGRMVSQKADGSDRLPVAGQAVGAFTQAVLPGKVIQHPPAPVATTVTSADGSFAFHRLKPGRYFITIAGVGPSVTGHWVKITARRGAAVLLIQCLNCPGPL